MAQTVELGGDTLTTALAGGPALATVFPSNNSLADPLRMVARMIGTATFTASDFSRTFTDTDGSDYGWGATHLIWGGAVNSRRFYGTALVIANNGPDDVGQGRLLPSTSVDQYAVALGRWFGISEPDLLTVLPNLGRWDVGVRGVGGGGWGLCDAIEAVFLLVARRQPF